MLIEFRCRNPSGFDAARGTYVRCGQPIIVPEEKIGDLVKCPKCQQEVEVPTKSVAESRSSGSSRPDQNSPSKKPERNAAARAGKSGGTQRQPVRGPVKPASQSATPKRRKEAADDDDFALSAPIKRPTSDLGSLEFDNARVSNKVLDKDKRKRCENCGGLIGNAKRCPHCGHVEQKFEKAAQPIDEIKIELAGFQRWFSETMNEGVSLKVLEYAAHISTAILGTVFSGLALFAVGGAAGVGLFVVIATLVGFYIAFVIKGHQLASNPRATGLVPETSLERHPVFVAKDAVAGL